jgi:hypothetical protein
MEKRVGSVEVALLAAVIPGVRLQHPSEHCARRKFFKAIERLVVFSPAKRGGTWWSIFVFKESSSIFPDSKRWSKYIFLVLV